MDKRMVNKVDRHGLTIHDGPAGLCTRRPLRGRSVGPIANSGSPIGSSRTLTRWPRLATRAAQACLSNVPSGRSVEGGRYVSRAI